MNPQEQEMLQDLIQDLPGSWFTQSVDCIQQWELQAQGDPHLTLLHEYLARYFHLAGDYEKAAFYALHSDPALKIDEKSLFNQAVETVVLDYYIYRQGGGLNGSCVSVRNQELSVLGSTAQNSMRQNVYQTT